MKRNAVARLLDVAEGRLPPDDDAVPGAIWYGRGEGAGGAPRYMFFVCPCGCEGLGSVSLRPGDPEGVWEWSGTRERPTVRASIYFNQGRPGEWHGFLTDGRFEEC